MAQPDSQFYQTEAANTATALAAKTINGKRFGVMMHADADGHVIGSRPDYLAYYPPQTNVVNRVLGELWNGSAAGILRVRGIWILPNLAAITGAAIGFSIRRTTAALAGTAVTPNAMDTTHPALPAGVAARYSTAAVALAGTQLWQAFTFNEETSAPPGLIGLINQLPQLGDRISELVLRPTQGLVVWQDSGATVGGTGLLVNFAVDN